MKNFYEYVEQKPCENLILEIANLFVETDIEPVGFLLEYFEVNETAYLDKYLELLAEQPIPTPQSHLGGAAKSVWSGVKNAWDTWQKSVNDPQRKFYYAYNTVAKLMNMFSDPQISGMSGTDQLVNQFKQIRDNLSRVWHSQNQSNQNTTSNQGQQPQVQNTTQNAAPQQAATSQQSYMNQMQQMAQN